MCSEAASQISSITPWNLKAYSVTAEEVYPVHMNVTWEKCVAGAQFSHTVVITGTAIPERELQAKKTAFLYLLAQALLHAMPEAGLEEACSSLAEVYEYHAYRPLKLLPAPVSKKKAILKPAKQLTPFRIAEE